jgi:hypothetical protein
MRSVFDRNVGMRRMTVCICMFVYILCLYSYLNYPIIHLATSFRSAYTCTAFHYFTCRSFRSVQYIFFCFIPVAHFFATTVQSLPKDLKAAVDLSTSRPDLRLLRNRHRPDPLYDDIVRNEPSVCFILFRRHESLTLNYKNFVTLFFFY